MIGTEIHKFASSLWHINRSISGAGVRETLGIIKAIVPEMEINGITVRVFTCNLLIYTFIELTYSYSLLFFL